MIIDDLTLLKEDIELGKLDFALADIIACCTARQVEAHKRAAIAALVESVTRPALTTADYGIGDRVRINENCSVKVLHGCVGSVIGKKRTKVVIKLDKPAGKYFITRSDGTKESSDITVPLSILDKI